MKTIFLILFLLFPKVSALAKEEFLVGVLYWSKNIEGQVIMKKGLEQEAAKLNQNAKKNSKPTIKLRTFIAGDGEKGIQNQIKQFYQLIKLKPDLIIVQPTDNAALKEPLLLANKKKIPVIAYDQYILGGKLLSFITSNNYQAGYLDGEYIASLFPKEKTIKLILVEYPNVSSTIDRVDGFFDALKNERQKFKLLKTYQAVEPVSGKKAGQKILRDFPRTGSVDVIFTINDGGGLALAKELLKAKRMEIKMATVDGDPESIKLLKAGKLIVIDSAQFCAELGRQSMAKAYDHLMGKKVPKKVLVPTFPITKGTLKRYPGWFGNIPPTFKKPWRPSTKWNNQYR